MSDKFYVVSDHAEDLGDGRVVAPTTVVEDVDVKDKHNARLIEEGVLLPYTEPEETLPTRDDLLARAEELDITGRHSMTVPQLQDAITQVNEYDEEADEGE